MHTLISIPFSHYNEKAKWALAYFKQDYMEKAYLPFFHMLPVWYQTLGSNSKADKVSSKFSTPVLKTDCGQTLCDSSEILSFLSEKYSNENNSLFPNKESRELEEHYNFKLGPHSRRIIYYYGFRNISLMRQLVEDNFQGIQGSCFPILKPFMKAGLSKLLNINSKSVERSIQIIDREFSEAEKKLEESPFLAGEKFSAADLCFASLAAPIVWVTRKEGYSSEMPELEGAEVEFKNLLNSWRERPAGQHVLKMFREFKPQT